LWPEIFFLTEGTSIRRHLLEKNIHVFFELFKKNAVLAKMKSGLFRELLQQLQSLMERENGRNSWK
jgi:hypothetical protein